MLVDSSAILLFFPFRRCSFLIFFSFYSSSRGRLSRRIRFPEFRSIIAFRFAIFSVISLRGKVCTARFGGRGSLLPRGAGSRCRGCSRRRVGRARSSSALRRSCGSCSWPFLGGEGSTDAEDVLGLFLDLLEDVCLFLLEEVLHLAQPHWVGWALPSIISSVTSERKSSMPWVYSNG